MRHYHYRSGSKYIQVLCRLSIVFVLCVDNDNFIVQFGTLWKERFSMSGIKGRSRQTFFRQGRAVFLNHVQLTFNCTQLQLKRTTNKSIIILANDYNGRWQVLESFARLTVHMLWQWKSTWGCKTAWNLLKYHTSQGTRDVSSYDCLSTTKNL